MNNVAISLNEEVLGRILRVPTEGTRSVLNKTCSLEFSSMISKTPTTKVAGIYKKIMKSEYQLVFKFVNKVVLPCTEKRTVATAADLYIMEMLCSFEALSLPSLMIEHIHKTVIERKGVHGMGYGYFLTEVFKHFQIPLVLERWGQLNKLSLSIPCLNVNVLKAEAYQKARWLSFLRTWISFDMRLKNSPCG